MATIPPAPTGVVGLWWDAENLRVPYEIDGRTACNCLRALALTYGSRISCFRAYGDAVEGGNSTRSLALRSALQSSGVSIIDTPHNGKKDGECS